MAGIMPLSVAYSADGSAVRDLHGPGHQTFLLPMLSDTLTALQQAATKIAAGGAQSATAHLPSGRLSLSSGVPYLAASTTSGTVYYIPYAGNYMPIWNGTIWTHNAYSELSLVLDTTVGVLSKHRAGQNYDLFVVNDAGTLRLVTGPEWTGPATRGAGAGTTQISFLNGILTNTVSMTAVKSGPTTITVPANRGTYVGSMHVVTNGFVQMSSDVVGTGGGDAVLGLFNMYNRMPVCVANRDSTASWTYNVAAWRFSNNSTLARFSFIDGYGDMMVSASFNQVTAADAAAKCYIGVAVDGATPNFGAVGVNSRVNEAAVNRSAGFLSGALGWHFIAGCESMDAAFAGTFFAGGTQILGGCMNM